MLCFEACVNQGFGVVEGLVLKFMILYWFYMLCEAGFGDNGCCEMGKVHISQVA